MPANPHHITIRPASHPDADSLLACLAAAFEPYRAAYTPDAFRDTILTPELLAGRLRRMTVLVAEDEAGNIVGTIACQRLAPDEGHLRGMAVHPDHQGHGVAERLVEQAESDLREMGCTFVTLDTTIYLERAMAFYRRCGYRQTGRVTEFFGMEIIEFRKVLA